MSLNFKIQTPWLKGAGKIPAERPDMSLDYLKGRALQYVLQHYGLRETSYREFAFSLGRSAQCEMAKIYVDGKRENRVVSVTIDGTRYPIPHWDFVPQIVDESQDTLTAFANSLTGEQACRLYDIIDPIAADDPVRNMTDEELLQELAA